MRQTWGGTGIPRMRCTWGGGAVIPRMGCTWDYRKSSAGMWGRGGSTLVIFSSLRDKRKALTIDVCSHRYGTAQIRLNPTNFSSGNLTNSTSSYYLGLYAQVCGVKVLWCTARLRNFCTKRIYCTFGTNYRQWYFVPVGFSPSSKSGP